MTLLHFGRVDAAVDVLTEGVANDPRNVEVYTTLDAALSARESPAPERAAALERYPDQAALPPALVYRLALAKAESGDTGVDALFRDRYFPPEEGGTGPERVLVAARALAARAAATSGRCDAARPIVDGLTNIGPGMPLAPQAMTEARRDPLVQLALARVESSCRAARWHGAERGRTEVRPYVLTSRHRRRRAELDARVDQPGAPARSARPHRRGTRAAAPRVPATRSPVVPCDGPPAAGRPEGAPAMTRALATILLTVF